MPNVIRDVFNRKFGFDDASNNMSKFTMEQLKAKSAALGLNETLATQVISMASDANLSAKAATKQLTWRKALDDSKISAEELTNALKKQNKLDDKNIKWLDDIDNKSSSEYRNRLKGIVEGIEGLSDEIIDLGDAGDIFSKKWSGIKDIGKGIIATFKPLLPYIAGAGAAIAAFAAFDYATHDYTRKMEGAQNAATEYAEAQSELDGLNTELETTQQKISELKALQEDGVITFAQEVELQKLENTNAELERQIDLQKSLTDIKKQASAQAAIEASKAEKSAMEESEEEYGSFWGKIIGAAQYISPMPTDPTLIDPMNPTMPEAHKHNQEDTTVQGTIKSNIKSLKEYEDQLKSVQNKLKDAPTDTGLVKQQEELLSKIGDVKQSLSDEAEILQGWIDQSTDAETGTPIDGMSDYVDSWRKSLLEIQNLGKSTSEIDLNNLKNFFSSSKGDGIEEYLTNVVKSSKDAKSALSEFKRLGLDLDSIGVTESGLVRYFEDIAKAAEEAAEATKKVNNNLTIDDIGKAFESKNAGDDYVTMSDYLKKAKELYDQGLVGTDDFKSVAEAISYGIDSSADSFKANYDKLQRYFTKDSDDNLTGAGMNNFLSDLQAKGQEIAQNDPARQYASSWAKWDEEAQKWTLDIDNTAEAAKELGISVQSMEAILGRLKDYDNLGEFNFKSAIKDFDTAKESLTGLDQILESMKWGHRKNALKEQVENWKGQLDTWEQDLSTLDTEIVAKIKLEYDLASIQAEIDKARELIESGDNSSQNHAKVIAGNTNYIETAEDATGLNTDGVTIPVQYETNQESIETLKDQLAVTSDEGTKIRIQAEIENLQEVQKTILDSFSDTHPEITPETDPSVVNEAWADYFSKPQKLVVDAELNDSEVSSVLSELASGSTIEFTADVSGVQQKVQAVKEEDGTIRYVANVNGVEQEVTPQLNKDGTVHFKPDTSSVESTDVNVKGTATITSVDSSEVSVPPVTIPSVVQPPVPVLLNYALGDQAPPKDETALANYKLGDSPKTVPDASGTANFSLGSYPTSLPAITQTVYRDYVDRGKGKISGTAKVDGTIGGLHPIPKLSSRALAMGTLQDTSWLKSSWRTKQSEVALTGEVGQEIVVDPRVNRWWTVGDNGAEFASIPSGAVVFNAKQSKELLENGFTNSRARLNGNAFAGGASGGLQFQGGASQYNPPNSGGSSRSSSVNNAADNLSKAATDTSEAAEKLSESLSDQIDWIERVFKAMERQFDHLMSQMERIAKLPDKQIKMYEALAKNQEYLSNTATAINKYRDHLTSLESQMGLDPLIYNQIKNGSFDISGYDEETKKLIQIYQDYYDKLEDCNSQYDELLEKQDELVQQALDNVEEYWEMMNNQQDTANGYLEKQRELWEELGHSAYGKEQESSIKESIKNQQELAESTQQQIKDYEAEISKLMSQGHMSQGSKEWYEAQAKLNELKEAAIDAQIGLVELEDELRNLKLTRLQHTIDMLDRTAQRLENGTSLTEAKGDKISEADLKKQLDNANALIQANFNKRQELVKEQGLYDVGSKRYQEIADEIAKLDDEIYNASENIEELKNKIWEVRWEPFFEGQEALKDLITETDDFRSMLHSDAFVGQNGGLTIEGITNLALISQGMNAAKQQIKNYNEALKKLDEDLKNGNISTSEYKEQQKDFLDSIRDSVGVVEDYKNEIVDLYRKQLEAENDMVQKSIEKYDKLLDIKKKNDDYSRNLKKQTKDINVLKAQIAALDSVNNEAAKAEKKRLEAQLAEAQDQLQQTQKDHEYEVRKNGFEGLSEDLNQSLEDTLNEVTYNAEKQEQVISQMLGNIVNNYQQAYDKIQSIIAGTGFKPSGDFNSNIGNLGTAGGVQNQVHGSITTAPNYKPNDFTNVNTGAIQSGSAQSNNDRIEGIIGQAPNTSNRPVAELKLNKTSVSLEEGQSTSITASIRPTDAKNKKLSWKSSNTRVATVSGGTIRAIKPGSAQVTASTTDGSGLSVSVGVTVTKKPEPPKPQPPQQNNTSGGDGIPRVGDKVRFNSGMYFNDSYGTNPVGNQHLGEELYITYMNPNSPYPIHLGTQSTPGFYSDLGWVRQDQISGYAKGTKKITNAIELARIDEVGKELRIKRGSDNYATFEYGDAIVPKKLTDNLFSLAENKNAIMEASLRRNVREDTGKGTTINQHYDNLINVEGSIDKDTYPGIKKVIQEVTKYFTQEAHRLGMHKKL